MSIIVGLIVAGIGMAVAAALISMDDTTIANQAEAHKHRMSTNA
ncbi:hypothetical protein [Mycolicibacterium komossense]|nr:hypothetical protein [Mycolicibacterium komossense]